MKSPKDTASRVADRATVTATHAMEKLEERRSTAFGLAVYRRFEEIDGWTRATLIAFELITTVLPLLLIGYAYSTNFSSTFSLGDAVVNQLALSGSVAGFVRDAFAKGDAMRSIWSFIGVFGFLIWAIPFTALVARTFGMAWRREKFPLGQSILRGTAWFLLYGVTLATSYATRSSESSPGIQVEALLLGMLSLFVLWSLTPVILVRNGFVGWHNLWTSGVAGVVVMGLIMQPLGRIVVPKLLEGWMSFGSIGVALGFMTWAGIMGVSWVVIACIGGVLWERSASAHSVLAAEAGSAEAAPDVELAEPLSPGPLSPGPSAPPA